MRRFPQQGLNCDQEYAETIDTMDRLLAIYAEIDAAIEADDPEHVAELREESARLRRRGR